MEPEAFSVLSLPDGDLLKEIFTSLTKSVNSLANPYSDDGSYAAAIAVLPRGLRAMAATHHLDISLTLDDIGWHFLNFGEPRLVGETEAGLRELGLSDMADWFAEAFAIVNPLRSEIEAGGDYRDCLMRHGQMGRIEELTQKASGKEPTVEGSPVYGAWIRYAREHPESVFRSQQAGTRSLQVEK
jgi:hypothetical protein